MPRIIDRTRPEIQDIQNRHRERFNSALTTHLSGGTPAPGAPELLAQYKQGQRPAFEFVGSAVPPSVRSLVLNREHEKLNTRRQNQLEYEQRLQASRDRAVPVTIAQQHLAAQDPANLERWSIADQVSGGMGFTDDIGAAPPGSARAIAMTEPVRGRGVMRAGEDVYTQLERLRRAVGMSVPSRAEFEKDRARWEQWLQGERQWKQWYDRASARDELNDQRERAGLNRLASVEDPSTRRERLEAHRENVRQELERRAQARRGGAQRETGERSPRTLSRTEGLQAQQAHNERLAARATQAQVSEASVAIVETAIESGALADDHADAFRTMANDPKMTPHVMRLLVNDYSQQQQRPAKERDPVFTVMREQPGKWREWETFAKNQIISEARRSGKLNFTPTTEQVLDRAAAEYIKDRDARDRWEQARREKTAPSPPTDNGNPWRDSEPGKQYRFRHNGTTTTVTAQDIINTARARNMSIAEVVATLERAALGPLPDELKRELDL